MEKISVTLGIYFFFSASSKSRGKGRPNMTWEARRSGIIVPVLDLDAIWGRFVKSTPLPLYRRNRNPLATVDEVVWNSLMVFMNMRRKRLLPPPGFKLRIVQAVVRCHPGSCPSLWHSVKASTCILNSYYYLPNFDAI
jgi:hypothetical protein